MGIKSKIKGSYAYTHWKLGKYTKRRVKNSIPPEWSSERQRYEHERVETGKYYNSDTENDYGKRSYQNVNEKYYNGSSTSIAYYSNGNSSFNNDNRSQPTINNNLSHSMPKYSEPQLDYRHTLNYSNVKDASILQSESNKYRTNSVVYPTTKPRIIDENITDVLVPSQKYKHKDSDLNTIGFYCAENDTTNAIISNPQNYNFTTNSPLPLSTYERRRG